MDDNLKNINQDGLHLKFLEGALLNKEQSVKSIFAQPELRARLDLDCKCIGMIYLSEYDDLKLFNVVHQSILKDGLQHAKWKISKWLK